MKKIHIGYLFALISVLLWATTATVGRLVLQDVNPFMLLAMKDCLAMAVLFLVLVFSKKLKLFKTLKWKDYLIILMLSVLGTFGYSALLYSGMSMIPSQEAFLINYLWPIMIVLFNFIIFKEKISVFGILGFIFSFCGVFLISMQGSFNFAAILNLGAGLAALAAVFYGLYSVLLKKFQYDKTLLTTLMFAFSFVLSTATCLIFDIPFPTLSGTVVGGVLWTGIMTSGIAFLTWALAIEKGKTGIVSNLAYLTPVLSLFIASIAFREAVTWYALAGLALILLGIGAQKIRLRKKEQNKKPDKES